MYICPHCDSKLKKVPTDAGYFWSCPGCNGRAVNLPVLRKVIPSNILNRLWQDARFSSTVGHRTCPACGSRMKELPLSPDSAPLYLDVCTACQFIWFDQSEFEKAPKSDGPQLVQKELSPVSTMTLAKAELELLREERKIKSTYADMPDTWQEMIPGVFGLPVEYDDKGTVDKPLATWALSVLMVLLYLDSFADLTTIVENWGLVPADLYRNYGATFITSFLLHGGILHLVGNLYFFLVFGDNVEETLGWRKYLLLIVTASLLGDAFHILADPRSTVPLIGASGGISGIIVYYALQFPRTRIGMFIFFRWYRVPVKWMMVLWLIAQVFGVLKQVSGFGNVSVLAHLGGASIGLLFWLHEKQSVSPVDQEKPAVGV